MERRFYEGKDMKQRGKSVKELIGLCLKKPCRRHVRKAKFSVCGGFADLAGLGCPQPAFQNIRKGYSETLLAKTVLASVDEVQ